MRQLRWYGTATYIRNHRYQEKEFTIKFSEVNVFRSSHNNINRPHHFDDRRKREVMQHHQMEYQLSDHEDRITELEELVKTLQVQYLTLATNDITMYDLKDLDANNCSCTCELD